MKKLFLFSVLIIACLFVPAVKAQVYTPPDSCLKMVIPNDPKNLYFNPDSVKIDSCIWSSTYSQIYGRIFRVMFEARNSKYIFNKIIPIGYNISLNDIDTTNQNAYIPFKYFFRTFNPIRFFRDSLMDNDSQFVEIQDLYCIFNENNCEDTIVHYLSLISSFHFAYLYSKYYSGVDVPELKQKKEYSVLYFDNKVEIKFNDYMNTNNVISLYNIYGQLVYQNLFEDKSEIIINTYGLAQGYYFLRLNNDFNKIMITR